MLRLFLSRSNTHNINNTRRSLVSSILSTSCSSYHSQQTVAHLRKNDEAREIFLVGTSHVSKASARETEELIRLVKPDVIAVELCEERFEQLKEQMKEDKEEREEEDKEEEKLLGRFSRHREKCLLDARLERSGPVFSDWVESVLRVFKIERDGTGRRISGGDKGS